MIPGIAGHYCCHYHYIVLCVMKKCLSVSFHFY